MFKKIIWVIIIPPAEEAKGVWFHRIHHFELFCLFASQLRWFKTWRKTKQIDLKRGRGNRHSDAKLSMRIPFKHWNLKYTCKLSWRLEFSSLWQETSRPRQIVKVHQSKRLINLFSGWPVIWTFFQHDVSAKTTSYASAGLVQCRQNGDRRWARAGERRIEGKPRTNEERKGKTLLNLSAVEIEQGEHTTTIIVRETV